MRVTGPDGRRWRVGRRWLAWRPRTGESISRLVSASEGVEDDDGGIFVAMVILQLPLIVLYLLNWAACLLATPFALLDRAIGGPWRVVAVVPSRDGNLEYRGSAGSFEAAGHLADSVRVEIAGRGAPRSLTPLDVTLRGQTLAKLGALGPPWLRRVTDGIFLYYFGRPRQ
jgi:hypothetical protein